MTSERTISQVRAILNKLDRSIDEAREKRRQTPAPTGAVAPSAALAPSAVPSPSPKPAVASPTPGKGASGFGRAQPLRAPAPDMLRFGNH